MILKIFFILIFSSVGYAKTLIVSDIDDTIKASHVRDVGDTISNAFVTTIAFQGMNEVYQVLLQEPNAEIAYVTNAPNWLMHKPHTEFIEKNFPAGEIYFRSGSSETHKYNTINQILQNDPSIERLVLVGDNGEEDIRFYDAIQKEYADRIDIVTYIRIVYAKPEDVLQLTPSQLGFVSPLEILADLASQGLIPLENYYETAEKIAQEVISAQRVDSKDPQYFPHWLNCTGFEIEVSQLFLTPIIEAGLEKVHEICKEPVQIQLNADSNVQLLSVN